MLSKVDARKKVGENSGAEKLLIDIETISKALYLDKTRPRSLLSSSSSRPKSVGKIPLLESKSKSSKDDKKDTVNKDKKSIWSWKGLKSLTHVRNCRFNCCFSLQVHSIEGLPVYFDDLSLLVHWKRRDGELMTRPVMAFQGLAEFEEQLTHSCSIYGSRSGHHHSAKYEAIHFLLFASVYGTPELDFGKHRIDLTRLLPLTLEDLEEEKSFGKWTTSFRLSGKAKGALLNVSFGYEVIGDNKTKDVSELRNLRQHSTSTSTSTSTLNPLEHVDQSHELSSIRRTGSLPARASTSEKSIENIKDLHEVLPMSKSELSDSISVLYQKLDEEKLNVPIAPIKPKVDVFPDPIQPVKPAFHLSSDAGEENDENEFEVTVTHQGAELSSNEQEKAIKDTGKPAHNCAGEVTESSGAEVLPMEETHYHSSVEGQEGELLTSDCEFRETGACTKESLMKEFESASNVSDLMKEGLDSRDESETSTPRSHLELQSNHRELRKGRSLSLDDIFETVASDFLDLLGMHSPVGLSSESEPESPRERLLRQFEKDALASGCSLFNFGMDEIESDVFYDAATESEWDMFSKNFDPSPIVHTSETMPKIEAEAMRYKTGASVLVLETEALMREWGLNEKAFQRGSYTF